MNMLLSPLGLLGTDPPAGQISLKGANNMDWDNIPNLGNESYGLQFFAASQGLAASL
jgi:hypothetical protein